MGESSVGGSVLSGAVRRSYAGPAPRGYGAELLVDDNRRTASAISSGVARMICCGLCGSAGAGLKIFGSIPSAKLPDPLTPRRQSAAAEFLGYRRTTPGKAPLPGRAAGIHRHVLMHISRLVRPALR